MKLSTTAKRNLALMWIIILSTVTIVYSNYLFIQQSVTDIEHMLIENEYDKIWWKENYLIMQELQKREMVWYIDKVKKEKPELIKAILEEKLWWKDGLKYSTINEEIRADLKKDSPILGWSWATVSIIEFSDLECPYCIKQHKQGNQKQAITEFWDDVNFIFKDFPLEFHKNAKTEAIAAKCIAKLSWDENYFAYLDTIFDTTKGGWEWLDLSILNTEAEKLWVNKDDFESCRKDASITKQVEREFEQGKMLKISSVPSTMILNNNTWKFTIISWVTEYEKMKGIIEYIK